MCTRTCMHVHVYLSLTFYVQCITCTLHYYVYNACTHTCNNAFNSQTWPYCFAQVSASENNKLFESLQMLVNGSEGCGEQVHLIKLQCCLRLLYSNCTK